MANVVPALVPKLDGAGEHLGSHRRGCPPHLSTKPDSTAGSQVSQIQRKQEPPQHSEPLPQVTRQGGLRRKATVLPALFLSPAFLTHSAGGQA